MSSLFQAKILHTKVTIIALIHTNLSSQNECRFSYSNPDGYGQTVHIKAFKPFENSKKHTRSIRSVSVRSVPFRTSAFTVWSRPRRYLLMLLFSLCSCIPSCIRTRGDILQPDQNALTINYLTNAVMKKTLEGPKRESANLSKTLPHPDAIYRRIPYSRQFKWNNLCIFWAEVQLAGARL